MIESRTKNTPCLCPCSRDTASCRLSLPQYQLPRSSASKCPAMAATQKPRLHPGLLCVRIRQPRSAQLIQKKLQPLSAVKRVPQHPPLLRTGPKPTSATAPAHMCTNNPQPLSPDQQINYGTPTNSYTRTRSCHWGSSNIWNGGLVKQSLPLFPGCDVTDPPAHSRHLPEITVSWRPVFATII